MFLQLDTKKYDLIHNHSLHYLPIILGNELKTPFITSLHTPAFAELQIALHCIDRKANSYFTSVSESLRKTYQKQTEINSHVVYNGIELQKWQYNCDATGDYFFWYGRICKEKALHLAIEAVKLCGARLLVAGPGKESDYFKKYIEPEIGSDKIIFLGHLKQYKINQYLKKAKALLFTSVWEEPYGLTIAESLACGTPVISWAKGAAPELLTDKTGFLIDGTNVQEMAKALGRVKEINRADCRRRAEEFCSIEAMVDNYEEFYNDVLNQN